MHWGGRRYRRSSYWKAVLLVTGILLLPGFITDTPSASFCWFRRSGVRC